MKKALIALVGLVMLAGVSVFATSTRTLVMGDNNMIMVDDNNMFLFPGRVNNYPNLALGEFGLGDEFYNFGVTWQFNEENPWVLGTFVSWYPEFGPYNWDGYDLADFPYYYYPWNDGWYYWYEAPAAAEQLSYSYPRRMQMVYGRKLGGNNFGFSVDVVRASWQAEDDSTQYVPYNTVVKQSFNQYMFGLGLTEGTSGKWDIGLNFMTGGWTNENVDGDKINEPSGFYDLGLVARYFWVRSPKITLVPHGAIGISKRGVDYLGGTPDSTGDDWKAESSGSMFDFGFGMNYTTGPNMLAVLDFGFSRWSHKTEFSGEALSDDEKGEHKETSFVFPYLKLGFEGEVFSWMDIRAGGYTELWSSSEKIESDFMVDQTWNTPSSDTYLGLGLHWGKLYFDTYMDPQIVLDGFNFISGQDNGNLNWQVSMLYEMF